MNLIEQIKNFFKKGVIKRNMKKEVIELTEEKVKALIEKHRSSDKLKWMQKGERYYNCDNDFKNEQTRYASLNKPDNKLVHSIYRNQVDEKVSYSFSKEASIVSKSNEDISAVTDVLSNFNDTLSHLAEEASNKGVAWLQVYINEEGKLLFYIVPSEEVIPVWKDIREESLNAVIRIYKKEVFVDNRFKQVEEVEVWTFQETKRYRYENGILIYKDSIEDFTINGQPYKWNKLPFIAFKNNRQSISDLEFIKSLIDNYDLIRSEMANYVQEAKNLIWVLKGYTGDADNYDELIRRINYYRTVVLDADDEDGKSDLKGINPNVDITAMREHAEQLKRDITEIAGSVPKDLDKFGSAPSGVALKHLYSGLELKCTKLENQFAKSFKKLLFFVQAYLSIGGIQFDIDDIDIVFNHDMTIDETSIIQNCIASQGIISNRTIVAMHPWVRDVDAEIEALQIETNAHNEAETDIENEEQE